MKTGRETSARSKKRVLCIFAAMTVLMSALLFRTAWIQVVQSETYTDMATRQQTSDISIPAKRGIIYDRNGEELAVSAAAYTVWVRPAQIREIYKDETKRTEMAYTLSPIIGKESGEILEVFSSDSTLTKLVTDLDKETAQAVRDLEYSGLEVVEVTKRYYPMGAFAATVLGSVNEDGVGRSGIELEYNDYLSGIAGRTVMDTDLHGNKLAVGESRTYDAQDGLNVVLTIDEVLQHYLDTTLAEGMVKYEADRIYGIAMNPKTGEILAMSLFPTFDPNSPTTPSDPALKEAFAAMSDEEQANYLINLWRNPMVSDVYEPGSTLKIVTSSAALEEGYATPETYFHCDGYCTVEGITMFDHERAPHGDITLTYAVGQSCNSTHMQIALGLGMDTFYKYLDLYGLTEPTGIDYPAESWPIVSDKEDIGRVELANMGFGQGIAITPIQLLTAASAVANDGLIMEPHLVKELTDKNGNTVMSFDPQPVRKAVSETTAQEMLSILEQQVLYHGGWRAQVPGYRIAGKTGTAERADGYGGYSNVYYASFIGMAPANDPEICVLIICDHSRNGTNGSQSAAPLAGNFFSKALPYLGIEKSETSGSEGSESAYAYVPDITGYTVREAINILDTYGIDFEVRPKPDESVNMRDMTETVVDQYPKAGKKITADERVYIYTE